MVTRDLAQCELELRALQRVAATVSRSFDLEAPLSRCLETALEVVHAKSGSIYLLDEKDGSLSRVAVRNLSDELAPRRFDVLANLEHYRAGNARIINLDDPRETHPALRLAHAHGFRCIISMPLNADRLVGLLTIPFETPVEFAPETLGTLEAISRAEAVAIENARAHRLVEARVRLANVLRQFGERALAQLDEAEAERLVLDTSFELLGADRAFIRRFAGGRARIVRAAGSHERLLGMEFDANEPHIQHSLVGPSPFLAEDADAAIGAETEPGRIMRENRTASFATITMRHGDKLIGQLVVGSAQRHLYTDEEVEAVRIFSSMAAELLERARVQAEADAERRRLDQILEHLPLVVAVLHKDGTVLHTNAAARELGTGGDSRDWRSNVNGFRFEQLDGTPIPVEELQIVRALRGETPQPREIAIVPPDGARRIAISQARPLYDDKGQVETVVASYQDVTALRELADAKDRFLRVASHELRSPITSLRATLSLLEMDPTAVSDERRRTTLLARVQRQVDRLTKLVEQLLDTARLNAREVPLDRAECDLVTICAHAIDFAPTLATGHRIVLEHEGPVVGTWDTVRLEQVVTNLIANAMRYSPSGSVVTVRVRARGDVAELDVQDEGIGIPSDQLDRVFTAFFRASNAASLHKGGLGLGLNITHEIVRRHGGRIRVTSTVGAGSTFTVELPRSP
jgi:signal transduction histidine kinase